jgi:hypothetical protein
MIGATFFLLNGQKAEGNLLFSLNTEQELQFSETQLTGSLESAVANLSRCNAETLTKALAA